MLRDVFYYGEKPNAHPREQFVKNLADARQKCTTEHFWIINEFCDYRNFDWDFDFEFLPDEDVWAEDHNNVWPSQHQKDSGTWLCAKEHSDTIIYRNDVNIISRKNEKQSDSWVELDLIDHSKFDFSWHPDPTDPPFIYKWGCKFFPAVLKHVLEYHVPGATQEKYMSTTVELLPQTDYWVEHQAIDKHKFDMSWRPNPLDPPFIYIWGNKYIDGKLKPTLEYRSPEATTKKYMAEQLAVLPEWDKWVEVQSVDKTSFDFTWRPDPREPDLIYVFGNEHYDAIKMPTIEYHCEGATERKYMDTQVAKLAPNTKLYEHLEDSHLTDYSWMPDPDSPPYIYVWGNQWNAPEDKISVQITVPGATEYKYMPDRAIRKPCLDNWVVSDDVDTTGFDFSWEPNPAAPPYIYEFATQWQKTGGPQYVVPGATEKQYVDFQQVKKLPSSLANWNVPDNIDSTGFDFSWHPDDTSPPYIYIFATQWAFSGGPVYTVDGATEIKYVDDQVAIAKADMTNWVYDPTEIDTESFDFSWHPYVEDQPYIYEFGTQWQKTGGPKYITPGADSSSPTKYIDTRILKSKRLPNPSNDSWKIINDYKITDFDFSWHPNNTEEPYIYVFGNNLYPSEECPTVEYRVTGATKRKYVGDIVATLGDNTDNWVITQPIDESKFDFSWIPNPKDPPYVYRWGNKYISNKYKATIEYVVPNATDIKYMSDDIAVLPEMDKWDIPNDIDAEGFDFIWRPDPLEPDQIWEFGTQWQKTGGPCYVVPGATEIKYTDMQKVKKLPSIEGWTVPDNIDSTGFDFSWHPDDTSPPYIYVFATQWAFSGGPVYKVDGATEIKYVDNQVATAKKEMVNWVYDFTEIDVESFDFSWHPYVEDQPYIYEFGTQWQKTGGPKYITPGADSSSPIKYIDTRILKAKRLPNDSEHWKCNYNIKEFDYSWHPNNTEEPFIYVFGNNLYPAEEMPTMEYHVKGATEIKYVNELVASLDDDRTNWVIAQPVNEEAFDFSWIPNPKDPPYVYRWGNKYISNKYKATVEYVVPGATEIKYMTDDVEVVPEWDRWDIPKNVDTLDFDFTWRPDPLEPDQIYQFGTQHQKTGGPRYVVPDATEIKYLDFQKVIALPNKDNWTIPSNVDIADFDFSWHPDDTDPAYIYQFGTQWALSGGPAYSVSGATEIKYMDEQTAIALPNKDNWVYDKSLIDVESFDFSWHPYVEDQPYIYEFGTQWQKTGGPKYITPGADSSSPIKYIDTRILKSKRLPNPSDTNWKIVNDYKIKDFNFSWHPDNTDELYIYVFGNNLYPAEECPTVEYRVPGATAVKFISDIVATLDIDMTNWEVPKGVDTTDFDFSWVPNPNEPDQIYQFGTQHQKTGGPRYVVPGATEIKYLDFQKVVSLPNKDNWKIHSNVDIVDFDFSWHPDDTDPAYIYQFGTQWALSGGPAYHVSGATEIKYMDEQTALALPNKDNWVYDPTLIDAKTFDFSWHPYAEDQPYIYEFGTQWQKTGGPKYITPGADSSSPIKYIDTRILKATRLPNNTDKCWVANYVIKEFDYSWHPDNTEEPYIYVFGNNLYPAEECATVEYHVPGATEKKYIRSIHAILDADMKNWEIPNDIVISEFDFGWIPNPNDPPYIYEFGTQHQKTGGPRYVVEGATEVKYIDSQTVTILPNKSNWLIPKHIDVSEFDFSWHPDATDPSYIYQFGTQWALSGGPRYIVSGATEIKYMDNLIAIAMPDKTNWVYDDKLIDASSFDFSWHPYAEDEPYIYEFGTQWQKMGGPKYIAPGADSSSPVKYIDTRIIKATRLPNESDILWVANYDIKEFDYSWHADETEEPYIYVFGNTLYPVEECATIEYRVPGATQVKYVHGAVATLAANMDNWEVPKGVDTTEFDFGWIPNPNEPPYIYEFGTQWQKTGGPRYAVSGAVETKYVDFQHATILPNRANWTVPDNIDVSEFDFSWHPDSTEPAYIYRFGTQWALSGGPVYTVPGATELKYMDTPSAIALPNKSNWKYDQTLIDVDSFDFSWHPYAEDEPFIYQFGTQHQKTGGPRYFAPGATNRSSVKYVDTRIIKATRLANKSNHWKVLNGYEIENFDYSWHPDETTEPYIYVFGNTQYSAEEMPTIQYVERGAESLKYNNTIKAKLAPNMANWDVPKNIDTSSFDFSWVPHPKSPPYIYEFATTWNDRGGPRYVAPGATEHFYVEDVKAKTLTSRTNWDVPKNIDTNSFDFSWVPHPKSPPYIYEFATIWNDRGGPKYIVPNATEHFYVEDMKANTLPSRTNWEISDGVDVSTFDFSWVPHPLAPPYIYQFGTLTNTTDGPRYVTPGNTGEVVYLERVEADGPGVTEYYIETTLEDLVKTHPEEVFWAKRKNIDYSEFNFAWRPESLKDLDYVQVFGSPDSELTQTYFVNATNFLLGKTDLKFIETVELTEETLVQMFVKPDMFFVDRSNPESAARFEALKAKFGTKIQKTRYLNSWVDTINRCINRSTTELVWILNSELDYSNFDFDYYPNPWQMKMVHVFGTQWNHWGTTFMVNRESFPEDTKYVKIIEHLSTLNFVKERRAIATSCVYDTVVIDHGNQELSNVLEIVNNKTSGRTVTTVPYNVSYFDTLKDIIKRQQEKKEHYIWICSSVCDYTDFDFSYICDPYAKDQLHVFPSGMQKFGDTFFVDVNKARELINDMEKLEDFHKVNFNSTIKVKRLPEPVIVTTDDTQIAAIKNVTGFPYATLITEDNADIEDTLVEPMNLWSPESKNILITSTGGTRIVVPAEAKDHVTNELYEYPYIKRMPKLAKSKALDIVFVSNGELVAEQNYEHLSEFTRGLSNKTHRVDGINGRTEALHAAAEQSETPWFFCVPAKLFVNKKFDWNYQADRMQMPKHYIFNAHNPVNDLFYGHQSMVLYNKNLVLNNKGVGLDFTLDSPHMTVELNSGIVVGDTDAHSTWRTAFREAVKLKRYSDNGDETAQQRLDVWTSVGKGSYGAWSIEGALDGLEFYDEVNGDLTQLRQSYYWDWLRTRFDSKY